MRARFIRYFCTRKHPGNFLAARVIIQQDDARARHRSLAGFGDEVMRLAFGRDLRTMRYRKQLRVLRQARKPLTDGSRHRTADAAVDFIKDNRRRPALFRQRDFQREDEARQLPARCDLRQRGASCGGMGAHRIAEGAPMPAMGEGKACEYCEARGLCRRDFRVAA